MTRTTSPELTRLVHLLATVPNPAEARVRFESAQLHYDLALAEQSALPEDGCWPCEERADHLAYEAAWAETRLLEAWGALMAAELRASSG